MEFEIITRVDNLPELDPNQPTFSDIESGGLYINPRLIQIYQDSMDHPYIIDLDKVPLEDAINYLKPQWLVFHNSSYDLGTLNFVPAKLDDTLFAAKMAYPSLQKYGLDNVIASLGIGYLYDGIDKKKLQKLGFYPGAYLSQLQYRYAAIDVIALSKIWEKKPIQNVINNNLAYKVDILSQMYAVQYQQNGLVVNQELRAKIEEDKFVEIDELTAKLPEGLNVNSSPQVKKYLGTENSQYDTLVKIANEPSDSRHEDALNIIKLKSARKQYGYAQSVNYPKMYTKFNVYGAATGRFSSTGGDLPNAFNAQQIPRIFQPVFNKDTEDTTVVALDYSTLELRLAAAIFNEPVMYQELMDGKDLHTEMAMLATGKKVHPTKGILGSEYETIKGGELGTSEYITKNDRTLAKAVNFGFVFGMSAGTFQNYAFTSYGVKLTEAEAQEFRNKYFDKYKGIGAYHRKIWKNVKGPGFVYTTALGRKVKPRVGTEAINGPVQGSGAETTKLAVHYLCREYPEALNYIINCVHDAIYVRVPKVDEDLWKERLKWAMAKGWTEIMKCGLFHWHDLPMVLEYD